jgi:hypothetical protein
MALLVHDRECAQEALTHPAGVGGRFHRRHRLRGHDVRIIGLEARQAGAVERPTEEDENTDFERQEACRR